MSVTTETLNERAGGKGGVAVLWHAARARGGCYVAPLGLKKTIRMVIFYRHAAPLELSASLP